MNKRGMSTEEMVQEYITHLRKARDDIEKKQDELLGPALNPCATTEHAKLESEFLTLGTVIQDLKCVVSTKEFSYWNN